MFGYTKKQLVHKNVRMLMTKKDSKKHNQYIDRYVETGIAQIIGTRYPKIIKITDL